MNQIPYVQKHLAIKNLNNIKPNTPLYTGELFLVLKMDAN